MKSSFLLLTVLFVSFSSCGQSKSDTTFQKEVNAAIEEMKQNRTNLKIDSLEKSLQADTTFGVTFAIYNKTDSSISIGVIPKFDVNDKAISQDKCVDFLTSHELYHGINIGFVWFVDARLPNGFKKGDKWTPKIIWGARADSAFEQ